jgi:hypothetical protein
MRGERAGSGVGARAPDNVGAGRNISFRPPTQHTRSKFKRWEPSPPCVDSGEQRRARRWPQAMSPSSRSYRKLSGTLRRRHAVRANTTGRFQPEFQRAQAVWNRPLLCVLEYSTGEWDFAGALRELLQERNEPAC